MQLKYRYTLILILFAFIIKAQTAVVLGTIKDEDGVGIPEIQIAILENNTLHTLTSTDVIVDRVIDSKTPAVVVTGGEPLIYNLDYITSVLKEKKIETYIETSGAYPLSGNWDWICLSPKKTLLPQEEIYTKAHELKIIVFNKHDFIFAEEQAKKVSGNCYLYLQPEWSKRDEIMPMIVDYVMANPRWMVSLQTHKYMNIP